MNKGYNEPTIADFNEKRRQFGERLVGFAIFNKMRVIDFLVDNNLVDMVTTRVHQRIDYYRYFHGKDFRQSRQAAVRAYWILRYRPLRSFVWKDKYDVNVHLAFFELFCVSISENLTECSNEHIRIVTNIILNEYKNDFLRAFSEYDISKEAMMMFADSIKSIVRGELKRLT